MIDFNTNGRTDRLTASGFTAWGCVAVNVGSLNRKDKKNMTIKQFFAALAALDLTWRLSPMHGIRARLTAFSGLACPVTAVANSQGGAFALGYYREAGQHLGMNQGDIGNIVSCADDVRLGSPIKVELLTAANRKDLI